MFGEPAGSSACRAEKGSKESPRIPRSCKSPAVSTCAACALATTSAQLTEGGAIGANVSNVCYIASMKSVATFLMFSGGQHGKAEEAVRFYTSVFDNGEILGIERYGAGESGPEGTVRTARFELNGTAFMAFDSALAHAFTFTPAM